MLAISFYYYSMRTVLNQCCNTPKLKQEKSRLKLFFGCLLVTYFIRLVFVIGIMFGYENIVC